MRCASVPLPIEPTLTEFGFAFDALTTSAKLVRSRGCATIAYGAVPEHHGRVLERVERHVRHERGIDRVIVEDNKKV